MKVQMLYILQFTSSHTYLNTYVLDPDRFHKLVHEGLQTFSFVFRQRRVFIKGDRFS